MVRDMGRDYVGGTLHGLAQPSRPWPALTPREVRATLPADTPVVAFQCRNPIHKAHYELIRYLSLPLSAFLRLSLPLSASLYLSLPLYLLFALNQHYQLITRRVPLEEVDGAIVLVHPTCGPTQPGDIAGIVRIDTYKALDEEVQNPSLRWANLPYSMKMAGPREAIQHMIIRKNFGCTHFIIGRDLAGTKSTLDR